MLPARSRVRSHEEHTLVARRGRRARRGPLVAHLYLSGDGSPARAGFVVGRPVGNAVVRNRVKRRLRELVRTRLDGLPAGALLVVRAQPGSGDLDSAGLGTALDGALRSVRADRTPPHAGSSA